MCLKASSLALVVSKSGEVNEALVDSCSSYCVVPDGPDGVQRIRYSTLVEAVLSARGRGMSGIEQGWSVCAAMKVLGVDCSEGQLSKMASTNQFTLPSGAV